MENDLLAIDLKAFNESKLIFWIFFLFFKSNNKINCVFKDLYIFYLIIVSALKFINYNNLYNIYIYAAFFYYIVCRLRYIIIYMNEYLLFKDMTLNIKLY